MINYDCETCGQATEIEEVEAMLGTDERFEHRQCHSCFDNDL